MGYMEKEFKGAGENGKKNWKKENAGRIYGKQENGGEKKPACFRPPK